jgi:hypothetical protein
MSDEPLRIKIAALERELAEAKARLYQANLVIDHAVTLVDRLTDKYREERERAELKALDRMLAAYFAQAF